MSKVEARPGAMAQQATNVSSDASRNDPPVLDELVPSRYAVRIGEINLSALRAQLDEWRKNDVPFGAVALTVSDRDLVAGDICRRIAAIVREDRVPPGMLTIGVRESVFQNSASDEIAAKLLKTVDPATGHVQPDQVTVLHQGQRATSRALRGAVQHHGAVRRAAHPGVGDPHHVGDPSSGQPLGDGDRSRLRHPGRYRTGVAQHQHVLLGHVQVRVGQPRRGLLG